MASGHKGVFRRVKRYKRAGKPVNLLWERMPREYRLPIKEIYGPRLTTVFLDEKVLMPTKENIDKRLQIDLEREINYEMSKLNSE